MRSLAVGSGCVKVATGGWEPSEVELKRARKAERAAAEARKVARIDAAAQPIADAVKARIAAEGWPTIELDAERTRTAAKGQRWWKMGDVRCGDFERGEGPDAERVACLRSLYAAARMREMFPTAELVVRERAQMFVARGR